MIFPHSVFLSEQFLSNGGHLAELSTDIFSITHRNNYFTPFHLRSPFTLVFLCSLSYADPRSADSAHFVMHDVGSNILCQAAALRCNV